MRIIRKYYTIFLPVLAVVITGCSYKPPFLPQTDLVGYKPAVLSATHLIEDSAQTLENYALHPQLRAIAEYLPAARGVFIMPMIRDYGVAEGFELGTGVMLVRTQDGTWSGPSFHDLISSDFTPHLTDRTHGAVVIFRSAPVLDAVIESGGDLRAAPEAQIGVVGAINHVSPLHNDEINIIVFTATDTAEWVREPFEQAALPADSELNEGLYGRGATPKSIFFGVVGEPATNHYPATTRRLQKALGP